MGLSLPHLIILAIVVLVLFGRGRISEMMGDFGKGIKSFKQGMSEEDAARDAAPPPAQIPAPHSTPAAPPQATRTGETVVDPNQTGPR
jgi:sec-independent protein translocase protein TatA